MYGVFNDVDVRSEARFDELTTEFTQITLEGNTPSATRSR